MALADARRMNAHGKCHWLIEHYRAHNFFDPRVGLQKFNQCKAEAEADPEDFAHRVAYITKDWQKQSAILDLLEYFNPDTSRTSFQWW